MATPRNSNKWELEINNPNHPFHVAYSLAGFYGDDIMRYIKRFKGELEKYKEFTPIKISEIIRKKKLY